MRACPRPAWNANSTCCVFRRSAWTWQKHNTTKNRTTNNTNETSKQSSPSVVHVSWSSVASREITDSSSLDYPQLVFSTLMGVVELRSVKNEYISLQWWQDAPSVNNAPIFDCFFRPFLFLTYRSADSIHSEPHWQWHRHHSRYGRNGHRYPTAGKFFSRSLQRHCCSYSFHSFS